MKKKIVVRVSMHCEDCRSKALKIASMSKGRVHSVAIEGDDRDRVVVVGEDVDSVCLGRKLRKKFCDATVVSVEDVKEKKEENLPPHIHHHPNEYHRHYHPNEYHHHYHPNVYHNWRDPSFL